MWLWTILLLEMMLRSLHLVVVVLKREVGSYMEWNVVSFSIKDSRRGCCKVEIVNINVKVLFCFAPSQSNWRTLFFLRATSSLQFVCLLHGTTKKTWAKKDMGAHAKDIVTCMYEFTLLCNSYGAFTLDVKLVLNENLGDIRCHPMKSKWHPRWRPMLNGNQGDIQC